jgi:hypothetical protein
VILLRILGPPTTPFPHIGFSVWNPNLCYIFILYFTGCRWQQKTWVRGEERRQEQMSLLVYPCCWLTFLHMQIGGQQISIKSSRLVLVQNEHLTFHTWLQL